MNTSTRMLAIGQSCCQSATPSYAIHTADLLQLINVMNSVALLYPDVRKILKSIKIIQNYDHKCATTFFQFTVY